jgi:hypothetical protein
MVKFTSSLLIAALVAAPVFASATWDELDSRDISEQHVFGRDLTETEAVFTRELDELFARVSDDLAARGDVEFQELAERSKIGNFFKKIWHGIKKVASVVIREEGEEEFFARDTDDLDARELGDLFERYIEEIEERTPGFFDFFKHGMKTVKAIAHKDDKKAEPAAADDDLEVREFNEEDIIQRDLDLENREFEELSARDLLDEEDLVERDFEEPAYVREYEQDLLQREYEQDLLERELEELDAREIDELD